MQVRGRDALGVRWTGGWAILCLLLGPGLPACEEHKSLSDAALPDDGDGVDDAADGLPDAGYEPQVADGEDGSHEDGQGDVVPPADDWDGHADEGEVDNGEDGEDGEDGADQDPGLPSVCPVCVPDCGGKECGSDGCGGECDNCGSGSTPPWCMVNQCVYMDWPNCHDIQCGWDAFGFGFCGDCATGWYCSNERRCAPMDGGCDAVPAGGVCMAGWVVRCEAGTLTYQECTFEACETDPDTQAARCTPVPCLPRCFGRTCGDDGCGGSCGTCEVGEVCRDELGVCLPESGCGEVGEAGACQGHVLLTCREGAVVTEECLPQRKLCVPAELGTRADCCPPRPDEPCDGLPAYNQCEEVPGNFDNLVHCESGRLRIDSCYWWGEMSCMRTSMQRFGCGHW